MPTDQDLQQLQQGLNEIDETAGLPRRGLEHRLSFPTIAVNNTIADLASSSASTYCVPRSMLPPRSVSTSTRTRDNAMEESFVNIHDDALLTSDDEEGHTASLTSDGRETPDDLSSLADTDFSVDEPTHHDVSDDERTTAAEDDGDLLESSSESVMDNTINDAFSMESTLTARPLEQSLMDNLRRRELPLKPYEQTLSLSVGEFSAASFPELERFGRERVQITVQQVISSRTPNAFDRNSSTPVRILVLGTIDQGALTTLTQNILQAMVVSRLKGGENIYEKLSECSRLLCFSQLKNHAQPTAKEVDLIICYHTAADRSQLDSDWYQTYSSLREEGMVPSLDIASPDLGVESPTARSIPTYIYDIRGLHTRVSDPDIEFAESNALQLNPVDFRSFLRLDSSLLAKHLACIMDASLRQRERSFGLKSINLGNFRALVKDKSLAWRPTPLRVMSVLIPLIICFASILFMMPPRPLPELGTDILEPWEWDCNFSKSSVATATSSMASSLSSELVASTSSAVISSMPMVTKSEIRAATTTTPPVSKTPAESASKKAVGMSLVQDFVPLKNLSKEFKGQVIGSNVIVLSPPQVLAQRRRPPEVFVQARRDGEEILTSLSKLENGAYAVEIPRKSAFGNVEFTIWTMKKPKLNQTMVLDLGSRWSPPSKIPNALADIAASGCCWAGQDRLLEYIKETFAEAQNKLQQASDSISEHVPEFESVVESSEQMLQEVQEASQALYEQVAQRMGSLDMSELWTRARQARLQKKHVKKAQRNAHRLWGKMRTVRARQFARKARSAAKKRWRLKRRT